MRANPDFSSNDYVLGGSYNTSIDSYGAYEVKMKLLVKLISVHDFGVYKCIAKNALGNSEEIIKLLRKLTFPLFSTAMKFFYILKSLQDHSKKNIIKIYSNLKISLRFAPLILAMTLNYRMKIDFCWR